MSIKQFALPYRLDVSDFTQGRNENFSEDLVKFTKNQVATAFGQFVTLTEATNFIRQELENREEGRWMCLFLPHDVKYSLSLSKFRYLTLSFMRKGPVSAFFLVLLTAICTLLVGCRMYLSMLAKSHEMSNRVCVSLADFVG